MTAIARPGHRGLTQAVRVGSSIALFVVGVFFDVLGVMNVPGAAVLTGGDDPQANVTPFGSLLVLLVLACWGTIFFRARAPLVVLVAGGLLLLIGVSYLLALIGAYCVIVRWPWRTRFIGPLTAAAVVLFVAREAFTGWGHAFAWLVGSDPTGTDPVWSIAAAIAALLSLGLVAALVAYRRARDEASTQRVEAAQQHERADALDQQVTRQAERERIARDLHDGLGHRLSSVALAAGAFESQAAAAPGDPALAEWARVLRQQAHAALEDVRGVVGGLRSDTGETADAPPPSMRGISGLVADLRAAGHRVDAYVFLEGIDQLGPAFDAAAFRIVQESLTNALKHAPGTPISVLVDAAPDRGIRIRTVNALAAGSSQIPGGRHGIEGMRERAVALGGTAWIGPYQGQFIVDVSLPWG
ncbi:sensor histidine kinase [Microbacterium kyungheense]|uniref:histidine kinase n=1 Tax=Microbacterium kyungheense TaxID=1263636 RepID=A0A543ES48_9MICO|nr:histidine kinase [Microbacterium kyungheense]TQM24414.1 signal transduction histidine kinase [Microbacterium kyungheense]